MNKLIIAEKPSVALRIALSLSASTPKRNALNGVSYYEVERGSDKLYIVAAVGHLFSLHQLGSSKEIPVFNTEWIASYKYSTTSYFTKKYLDVIEEIGKKCSFFINACDYDIEGTVIGSNLLKDILNKDVNKALDPKSNVARMRFSTTTKQDLEEAYSNLNAFDFNNLYAGEARHILDWMWGINLSRALMHALMHSGVRKIMSIGRVQGPALSLLAKRETEIKSFVPKPFWRISLVYNGIEFENRRGNIMDKGVAEVALRVTSENKAIVKSVEKKEGSRAPFPPFDLTSLQLEASRVFRLDPSRTLAVAQSLYERSYISYPRTASQKLPQSLNLRRIISLLAQNERYKALSEVLMSASRFRPREGQKEDEAHPAIYPTGEAPKRLSPEEEKVYDLIARRFLAAFAGYYRADDTKVTLVAGIEEYHASGSVIKERGWLDFYTYYKPNELALPDLKEGVAIDADAKMKEAMTEPPKRYTKAGMIATLEKKELGTKATRAAIIDTLFNRSYIMNSSIQVTEYGMSVYGALNKYCSEILDEELTRRLEEDMEKIARGSIGSDAVINEGKEIITRIISIFKKNENAIGEELNKGLKESEMANVLGKCPRDGGNLIVRMSRAKKIFVGCSSWPNCSVTYPLPQHAKIVPLHKTCEKCHTPIIKVFAKGKVFEMDLDPNCETKKNWRSPASAVQLQEKGEKKTVSEALLKEEDGKAGRPSITAKKKAVHSEPATVKGSVASDGKEGISIPSEEESATKMQETSQIAEKKGVKRKRKKNAKNDSR